MSQRINRRQMMGAAGAAMLAPLASAADEMAVEISQVSPHTFRLRAGGAPADDGALVQAQWGAPVAKLSGNFAPRTVKAGGVAIQLTSNPLGFAIVAANGDKVQQFKMDPDTGALSFVTGSVPLLGLGQGGPQFDRRGSADRMRSGQGGYQLRTFGGRVPIQWLVGTNGWAMFIHSPYGTFDFTGAESKFLPPSKEAALPLDLFFVTSKEPAVIMAEYARITGRAELPPLWSFGYHQSHRTLASSESVLAEAKMFREKKLPCESMIYLGTGFCPSGWNTNNTEFTFNVKVFPDPKVVFDKLHEDHFKVVLHIAYPTGIREMTGSPKDRCEVALPRQLPPGPPTPTVNPASLVTVPPAQRAEAHSACYWDMHRPLIKLGVDGWWPDEGDALNTPSRLVRNRMYWEGEQIDRPNERPFALHRNGFAGMQRYASFLWSGDVNSQWETLKNHLPIAVNTGLTGIPYWGTDIGGFVPTKELTGELYVRWFQFGAFNTLFRSHGRVWPLRLPWGWDQGAPTGDVARETPFTIPESEYHNHAVEPICKKYLELRYRMMPYLYSAVRECTQTGMPVLRAMWLHYPEDAAAVARGDQYLWGRDLLVAPVVEQGATSRKLYLPRGTWFDFWSGEKVEGGREITRPVDLETTPLYARAGAIIPMGPVKQYTAEKVDGPTTVTVYPGANGAFLMYEDDGSSFAHRKGEWMGMQMSWNDARKALGVRLANGSKVLGKRELEVKMGSAVKKATFDGKALEVRF